MTIQEQLQAKFEFPLTIFSMWAVYHMLWYWIFRTIFRRIPQFKKRLQDLNIPYESEVEWYGRCVSTEHAIGALILALLWHLGVLEKDIVLTHTAAYFLYDIFVVATHIKDFKQETSTFIHHGLGFIASWASLLFSAPTWLVKYYLLTEVSTIFVNLRWNFYLLVNKEGKIYLIVGLLMALSFCLVRTVPLPYVWINGAVMVWWENTAIGIKITVFLVVNIFCCLNAYWSFKIAQGVKKVFWPSPVDPIPEANP